MIPLLLPRFKKCATLQAEGRTARILAYGRTSVKPKEC